MTFPYAKTLMGRTVKTSAQVERLLDRTTDFADLQPAEQVEQAVLFTDIVGSTAYFERHGDQAGLAMVERHNWLLFPLVSEHQGTIVKTIGDAIMAGFPSATSAVMSAVAMQHRLERYNQNQPEQERILVRIGINCGQVLSRGGDLFGDVVNAAARVESLAHGGQILILAAVEQQLDSFFDIPRVLFDAVRLKGKQEPIEVYEVRWDPEADLREPDKSIRLESGSVLGGRFEIKAQLGEGGMGQVYQAYDHALGEGVALKFIRPEQATSPETLAKFKTEIRLARSITHPNICRIHEFLEMEGKVFLSMEWVRGRTLADLLEKQGSLDPKHAISITRGICRGLEAAHDRGITHRDLKPANVMIEDKTQRVILMDFGIAQLSGRNGLIEGTPEYMSPEQVEGQQVGPASDIYSLGVILYEMLSGRPPHIAETPVAVAIRHLTSEPEPLEKIRPDLSPRITRTVRRCLLKQPDQRFSDPNSLALTLDRKHLGKRMLWLFLLFTPLVLAVIAFTMFVQMYKPTGPAAYSWNARVLVSSRSVDSHARMSPDGQRIAFFRNRDLWSLAINDDPHQLTSRSAVVDFVDIGGLSWSPDGLKILVAAGSLDNLELRQVEPSTGSELTLFDRAVGADLCPHGNRLAFAQPNSHGGFDLAISQLDGSARRTLLKGDASRSFVQPRWSPDGKQLVLVCHQIGYQSTRDIGIVEIATPTFRPLTTDGIKEKAYNTDPTWTPDGEWILYASKRSGVMSLWQVPSAGGLSTPLTPGAVHEHRQPDMSPDKRKIVFSTHQRQMDIAYLDSSGRTLVVTQDIWADRFPIFSPDGKRVAFRTQRSGREGQPRSIVIYDLGTYQESQIEAAPGARDFCWCGSNMFYAATIGEKRFLGRIDLKSGSNQTLLQNFHRLWSPACNESDLRVVFVGQRSKDDTRALWMLEEDHQTLRRLSHDDALISYPAFSPDGRQLAYRWAPSIKRLGEAELRIQPARFPTRPRTVTKDRSFQRSQRRIHFSADGRHLYYMETIGTTGKLWSVSKNGGSSSHKLSVDDVHTLDFDIAPDGKSLVYAKVIRQGDLYLLKRAD